MNQIIYWKKPVPIGVQGNQVYWAVGFGRMADMPDGAMTGEQELPMTLLVDWREIERPGAAGTQQSRRALWVLSPPLFARRYVYLASAFLEIEELEQLATTVGRPSHLLDLYLAKIQAGQIDGPAEGTSRENFWWALQEYAGYPTRPPRRLQKRWFRSILAVLVVSHPKASDILTEWDRRVAGPAESHGGEKKAGCVVFSKEPMRFKDGSCLQIFEMRARKFRTQTRTLPLCGRYILHSKQNCLPVGDEALENVGIPPVLGFAAMLSRHGVQMRAAPSAHARLQLDMQNAPLLDKWGDRFEIWRSVVLSDGFVETDLNGTAPVEQQIEAAIIALLNFTDVTHPSSLPPGNAAPARDRRAQEFCNALFQLKEVRSNKSRPEIAA